MSAGDRAALALLAVIAVGVIAAFGAAVFLGGIVIAAVVNAYSA